MAVLPKPIFSSKLFDGRKGLIEFIYSEIPPFWNITSLEERRRWWADPEFRREMYEHGHTIKRDRITVIEIWCEYFGYEPQDLRQWQTRMINGYLKNISSLEPVSSIRTGIYGKQRGYHVYWDDQPRR